MEVKNKSHGLQQLKYDLFKSQNPEIGRFDVIFEVQGKLLYAHKNMLTLVSDTFDAMLCDRWTKKDQPIKIKDYGYNDFYQFLTFLYSGECKLNDENIYSMVDIAEFYGVELFKEFCDEYLSAIKITVENIFQLLELTEKYSMVQLKASVLGYICNNFQSFVNSDGFLHVPKCVIEGIITSVKDAVKAEDLFKAVFKWTEKQASDKQIIDPNININDSIKAEISVFLPQIDFRQMELYFLHKFVVPKGFIFPSLDQLSEILCERHNQKIQITNCRGQTLHGDLIPDKTVIENIKSTNLLICLGGYLHWCWWDTKFTRPSTPSPLHKRDGIEWYLIYDYDGEIAVIHCSYNGENDYLLAELTPGPSGFDTAEGCKMEIE